jgi:hypothetical protein
MTTLQIMADRKGDCAVEDFLFDERPQRANGLVRQ